jgi:hypothetical protein
MNDTGRLYPGARYGPGHRHLQGRHTLYRHEAFRRLSVARRGAVMGCSCDSNQPCRHTSLAYSLDGPAHRSEPQWQRR